MKPSRRFSYFSSSTTTVTYTFCDDQIGPQITTEIPPIPIAVHLPQSDAAAKIQSAYRAYKIRKLYKTISSVNSEADHLQRQIQRQETVDAVRSNEKERLRMNEALMSLLLRLDSVPGFDTTVREARRKVSRRIVELQEILDGICEARMVGGRWEWDPYGGGCDGGFSRGFDEVLAGMEEEFCRERGGEEMERFCAQYLGFRCLQRFLREP
uniref:BAG family molecular chaperone regulator 5 n=1 Tax=Rhizophora mucronata TaxID=61149 RepID=A0A2P2NLD8_RHIMU